jgi:glycogen debranching enzyme
VTILEGSSFCVSGASGDMAPDFAHGWFHRDTRALSRWNLRAGGSRVEPLDVYTAAANEAVFLGRVPHGLGRESTLVVERHRVVGEMLREQVTVRNFGTRPATCTLVLRVETDFADLFDVKAAREGSSAPVSRTLEQGAIRFECHTGEVVRRVRIACADAVAREAGLTVTLTVPAKGTAAAVFTAEAATAPEDAHPLAEARREQFLTHNRAEWLAHLPQVEAEAEDEDLERVLERSVRDLGALRIEDPIRPGRVAVAAGAPWFMALFGRDSLITSYLALGADPSLALGTLEILAAHQGRQVVDLTEEEPGRILHEVRRGRAATQALDGASVYYGTADATPLFVVLLGELYRWGGLTDAALERLLPHADRALEWVTRFGDADSDGFVEYARRTPQGLLNQGWKDSWDGITFADGSIPTGPIALAEVQGYVYRAWLERAMLARATGDDTRAADCEERAAALREAFDRRFWLDDRGWFAVALDGDKRPVDALTSNIGHCLWSGLVEPEKAALVAAHLVSPRMFTGWGVRSLAEGMGAYNPVSYHNGSVWPHDNALIVDGLRRYGFVGEAQRVVEGLLDAARHFRGRLPELFCGFGRDEHPEPISYPTSCSPQAWAAATPIHLARVLLGFDPDVPRRSFRLEPALPASLGSVRVENLPLAGGSLTFSARGRQVLVELSPAALKRAPSG